MHGGITLDSVLGAGTTASFWILFNKPQFVGKNHPLVDVSSLSGRLQSELSISGCDSDPDRARVTPPQSPIDPAGDTKVKSHPPRPKPAPIHKDHVVKLDRADRKNIHVLVVEDK